MSDADDDKKFEIPCPDQKTLHSSIHSARKLLERTVKRLQQLPMSVPEDPRLITPFHEPYTEWFKVEPGLKSMREIIEIRDRFKSLETAVSKVKVVCLSAKHPMARDGEWWRLGMAYSATDPKPTIYLFEKFFAADTNPGDRARSIIHETSHAHLATHDDDKGQRFLAFGDTPSPLKNFDDAIDNAYSYDGFVDRVPNVPPKAATGRHTKPGVKHQVLPGIPRL